MADAQAARERRVADRARIVDIATQIIDLECSIRALRAEKQLLEAEQETLHERLDAYTYPVLTFPPEVVSKIFVRFLPAYPKRAPQKGLLSPITLGQICQLRREIAFSTPKLWRTFGIFLRGANGEVLKDRVDQVHVEAALGRSGSCPLSVELDYVRDEISPLFETIMAHRTRWQHLKLFVPMHNFAAIDGPFPLLRTLTTTAWILNADDETQRSTAFRASPLLRRVAIEQYEEIFHDMLPWSQLTVLLIQGIQIKQCITILALASLLVYGDLTFSRRGEGDTEDDMPSHVEFAHMKHLKLRGLPWLGGLLSILTLPALQRLHIDEALLFPDPITALQSLLSHWGSKPEEIRIGFPVLPVDLYSAALPSIVFSSLAIRFLDPQPTNLVGLEAANIDEEGDEEEASSSEDEEFDAQEVEPDDDSE
ncbi:hypothetical protein B0H16DRAFT_1895998 [Mycena metata]|uniref:F-box domain-containing protein n=1 Tax=Mycena metata TaxID=1033252 RepID=A0AAD7HKL8_9AGAR|nr:hypothetical protein B0H16DRAFT_1895998 [Mycena metata]